MWLPNNDYNLDDICIFPFTVTTLFYILLVVFCKEDEHGDKPVFNHTIEQRAKMLIELIKEVTTKKERREGEKERNMS